jgi:carboxyl-terminal processing protease
MNNRGYALAIAGIVVAASLGYALGARNPRTVVIEGLDNAANGPVSGKDFIIFWDTWQAIQNAYLRAGEIKRQDLIYGAATGLVEALDDPYSMFLTPSDAKKFTEDINGNFGGIGAEIGMKNDQLIVVAPLKNTPAERAGLLPGDKILEINASSTISMDVNEAVKRIRGTKGTSVTLTIGRSGKDKPFPITITRDTINVPVLELAMKEGGIAHIQLFTFSEDSAARMRRAIASAKEQGAQGIVLDMRNNPGGYLDAAVDIAGYFVPRGQPIVYEEFRNGRRDAFIARGDTIAARMPLVVILNNGSASASEIVAGALKDNLGTKIIGEKSFGKGTVQELTRLRDRSEIKLTIAHWILPKGAQIDKNGIMPDIEIKLADEDREQKRDPQLDKAIEILRQQIEQRGGR